MENLILLMYDWVSDMCLCIDFSICLWVICSLCLWCSGLVDRNICRCGLVVVFSVCVEVLILVCR